MRFLRILWRVGVARFGAAAVVLAGTSLFAAPKAPSPPPAVQQSQEAAQAMLAAYYDPASGLLAPKPAPSGEPYDAVGMENAAASFKPAALWDYSWALAALEDVAQLPGGSHYLPTVRTLADNLGAYWDARAAVPAYAPTTHPLPDATKFFDDNAWVGLDLVRAYDLTDNIAYLYQAEAVFRYEQSGWDRVAGGIYWNDKRITRNTESNAPVAELGVYLYIETHQKTYLDWAEKIYHWQVRHLVDPRTGMVWGSIDASSHVSKRMWTYNQGSLIGAAVLLYQVTERSAYLSQAERTASYTLQHAVRPDGALVPQSEFNGVLVDDLRMLFDVTHDRAIRRVIATNARLAWNQAQTGRGLFGPDWEAPPSANERRLLLQTGAVRLLAVNAALAGN